MVCNSVCAGMIERGSGQIVNNSSMAGKAGYPCRAYYAASKHAIIGLMDCLRFEVRSDTANGVFTLKHANAMSLLSSCRDCSILVFR